MFDPIDIVLSNHTLFWQCFIRSQCFIQSHCFIRSQKTNEKTTFYQDANTNRPFQFLFPLFTLLRILEERQTITNCTPNFWEWEWNLFPGKEMK